MFVAVGMASNRTVVPEVSESELSQPSRLRNGQLSGPPSASLVPSAKDSEKSKDGHALGGCVAQCMNKSETPQSSMVGGAAVGLKRKASGDNFEMIEDEDIVLVVDSFELLLEDPFVENTEKHPYDPVGLLHLGITPQTPKTEKAEVIHAAFLKNKLYRKVYEAEMRLEMFAPAKLSRYLFILKCLRIKEWIESRCYNDSLGSLLDIKNISLVPTIFRNHIRKSETDKIDFTRIWSLCGNYVNRKSEAILRAIRSFVRIGDINSCKNLIRDVLLLHTDQIRPDALYINLTDASVTTEIDDLEWFVRMICEGFNEELHQPIINLFGPEYSSDSSGDGPPKETSKQKISELISRVKSRSVRKVSTKKQKSEINISSASVSKRREKPISNTVITTSSSDIPEDSSSDLFGHSSSDHLTSIDVPENSIKPDKVYDSPEDFFENAPDELFLSIDVPTISNLHGRVYESQEDLFENAPDELFMCIEVPVVPEKREFIYDSPEDLFNNAPDELFMSIDISPIDMVE